MTFSFNFLSHNQESFAQGRKAIEDTKKKEEKKFLGTPENPIRLESTLEIEHDNESSIDHLRLNELEKKELQGRLTNQEWIEMNTLIEKLGTLQD